MLSETANRYLTEKGFLATADLSTATNSAGDSFLKTIFDEINDRTLKDPQDPKIAVLHNILKEILINNKLLNEKVLDVNHIPNIYRQIEWVYGQKNLTRAMGEIDGSMWDFLLMLLQATKVDASEFGGKLICNAIADNRNDVVKTLVAQGATLDSKDDVWILSLDYRKKLTILVEAGLDLNHIFSDKSLYFNGCTLLIRAIKNNGSKYVNKNENLKFIDQLLKYNVDVTIPDISDMTAIEWALECDLEPPQLFSILSAHIEKLMSKSSKHAKLRSLIRAIFSKFDFPDKSNWPGTKESYVFISNLLGEEEKEFKEIASALECIQQGNLSSEVLSALQNTPGLKEIEAETDPVKTRLFMRFLKKNVSQKIFDAFNKSRYEKLASEIILSTELNLGSPQFKKYSNDFFKSLEYDNEVFFKIFFDKVMFLFGKFENGELFKDAKLAFMLAQVDVLSKFVESLFGDAWRKRLGKVKEFFKISNEAFILLLNMPEKEERVVDSKNRLIYALICHGNSQLFKSLFSEMSDQEKQKLYNEFDPIELALNKNQDAILEFLLQEGGDPNYGFDLFGGKRSLQQPLLALATTESQKIILKRYGATETMVSSVTKDEVRQKGHMLGINRLAKATERGRKTQYLLWGAQSEMGLRWVCNSLQKYTSKTGKLSKTQEAYAVSEAAIIKKDFKSLALRYQNKQAVVLATGWKSEEFTDGHAVGIGLFDGCLVFTNRGQGKNPNFGSSILKIKPNVDIEKLIEQLSLPSLQEAKQDDIEKILKNAVENFDSPSVIFKQKAQKHGTCSVANRKSLVEPLEFLFKVKEYQKTDPISLGSLDKKVQQALEAEAHDEYKDFTNFIRTDEILDLIEKLEAAIKAGNIREASIYGQLAVEYILEHPDFGGKKGQQGIRICQLWDVLPQHEKAEVRDAIPNFEANQQAFLDNKANEPLLMGYKMMRAASVKPVEGTQSKDQNIKP